eukprot:scaffold147596_cov17-Prasinocladus_malaysianus.AAC.1
MQKSHIRRACGPLGDRLGPQAPRGVQPCLLWSPRKPVHEGKITVRVCRENGRMSGLPPVPGVSGLERGCSPFSSTTPT